EGDYLTQWAATQEALAVAYAELPTGDRAVNLSNAITCYEAALGVHTEADFPIEWATTQSNLALALVELAEHTGAASWAKRAADCFTAAARGFTACGLLDEAQEMRRLAKELRAML